MHLCVHVARQSIRFFLNYYHKHMQQLTPDTPHMFLRRLGSLNSAIEAYSAAINLDQAFVEAIVGRGNVFMDYLTEEMNMLSR